MVFYELNKNIFINDIVFYFSLLFIYFLIESIEISSVLDSSEAVKLSNDILFADSTITY
jgi:hypothetical protein